MEHSGYFHKNSRRFREIEIIALVETKKKVNSTEGKWIYQYLYSDSGGLGRRIPQEVFFYTELSTTLHLLQKLSYGGQLSYTIINCHMQSETEITFVISMSD